jgi:hypothetical protein
VVEATSNDSGGGEERVDEIVGLPIPYAWADGVGDLFWLGCSKVRLVTGLLVGWRTKNENNLNLVSEVYRANTPFADRLLLRSDTAAGDGA